MGFFSWLGFGFICLFVFWLFENCVDYPVVEFVIPDIVLRLRNLFLVICFGYFCIEHE